MTMADRDLTWLTRVTEHGFPPEQHCLRIPIDTGHPGWVYRRQRPLRLANTDAHADFKQVLKTSGMGRRSMARCFGADR
jgi:signal transduction protein with GAF and PtsI domain